MAEDFEIEEQLENSSHDILEAEKEKNKEASWLRPWQFKPGQSGNPGGRPKGTVSLKEYAKKYLRELDEEEKLDFMKGLSKDIIWKMAEGNPQSDLTSAGEAIIPIPILNNVPSNDSDKKDSILNEAHQSNTGGDISQQDNLNLTGPDRPSATEAGV